MKISKPVLFSTLVLLLLIVGATLLKTTKQDTKPEDLFRAASAGDTQGVQTLLSQGVKVDATSPKFDLTPLMIASQQGNTKVAQILLEAGANTEARASKTNWTPLMFASSKGRADVVQLLIEHKSNVNAVGPHNRTALSLALDSQRLPSQRNSPDYAATVALLRRAGAK